MTLRVECYCGWKGDERPIRFQLDGREHLVEEVVDQWHGTDATFFRIHSNDGNFYVLRHARSPQEDSWSLESFRRGQSSLSP